jgi:hypothetical protein
MNHGQQPAVAIDSLLRHKIYLPTRPSGRATRPPLAPAPSATFMTNPRRHFRCDDEISGVQYLIGVADSSLHRTPRNNSYSVRSAIVMMYQSYRHNLTSLFTGHNYQTNRRGIGRSDDGDGKTDTDVFASETITYERASSGGGLRCLLKLYPNLVLIW